MKFSKHKGKTGNWDTRCIEKAERNSYRCVFGLFCTVAKCCSQSTLMSSLSCKYQTPLILWPLISFFGSKWDK